MPLFDPVDWYWFVAGDTTKVYSSNAGAYVQPNNAAYQTWLGRGNVTARIDSEATLAPLLATYVPNITLTSTVLVIQQALRQAELDLLLEGEKADTVKMVRGGQSSSTSGTAVANYLSASTNNYRSLRSAIAAAASPVAVRAVDINSGWPNNP